MGDLNFNGRVAVVTGAGAGLGRAYALLFASRGAKVVVNDLGGDRKGGGMSSKAADAVVKEITDAGGIAVADYNNVVEGEKVIQTALDNFGRIDILVNNAGILRDKSFARISDQDWDIIHAVHVKGSFKTTQAAWPVFKKQNYGRIIMTASNSGIYGNFGQANYSAAKLGLVGLCNTIAIEGQKNNIHCNVIVPTAASRLTEDILPPEMYNELRPELIAPVVAYLCHDSCEENATVVDSAMGWAAKVHMVRGSGSHLRDNVKSGVSIENVRDNWSKVVDMSEATRLNSLEETISSLYNNLTDLQNQGQGGSQNNSHAETFSYQSRDFALYALGIGSSVRNPTDLKFLYENHEDFTAFPTMFVLPCVTQAMTDPNLMQSALPAGVEFSFANILHGEQYIEILGDLPQGPCNVKSNARLVETLDKGSGAVVVLGNDVTDESGNLIARCEMAVFLVGSGGFGGQRKATKAIECIPVPSRKPDATVEQQTGVDQAALYRMSGDLNPIHIDPEMSAIAGHKQPILHGLCSLGYSARHILMQYGNNDAKLFKAMKVRFVKPVLPGQTLVTSMWRNRNRIHFKTSIKETGVTVIDGAYVDLKDVSNMPIQLNNVAATLASDAIFEGISAALKTNEDKAKAVNGVFLYNIMADGKQVKQWTMDLKTPKVYEGAAPQGTKIDTTITVSDSDMVDLATGKLNPQVGFMKGKLKITGNIMLTQKLVPLLKVQAKL